MTRAESDLDIKKKKKVAVKVTSQDAVVGIVSKVSVTRGGKEGLEDRRERGEKVTFIC